MPAFELDQRLAHVHALLQRRDEVLLGFDGQAELVALGCLLPALGVVGRRLGLQLTEISREHLLLAIPEIGWDILRPGDLRRDKGSAALRRRQFGLPAKRLRSSGGIVRGRRLRLRLRLRGVELQQLVAGLHRSVVGHVDRRDLSGLQRLDHLDPAGRLELALCGGDDVDPAEIRPGQRDDDERAYDPDEGHPGRRGRRLQDFQGRRQKLAVGKVTVRAKQGRERSRREGPRRGLDADERSALAHEASSAGWLCRPQR